MIWMDQAANEYYWAVNTKSVNYGGKAISQGNQNVIFDNGMSLAMAPESSFVEIVKKLHEYGFECVEGKPIW